MAEPGRGGQRDPGEQPGDAERPDADHLAGVDRGQQPGAETEHTTDDRPEAADLRPAIYRALKGFRIDRTFAQETKESLPDLRAFTSSRRLFLRHGRPLPVGSRLRNPALARTVQHPPVWSGTPLKVRPGIMTTRDLARYRAEEPKPWTGRTRPPAAA